MAAVSQGGTWISRQWRRAADWERRRRGGTRLPMLISSRRVYILPTRAGVAFAALLLVMLLAGLNYSNSMAIMFTFMLAGFGLIAMHLCHRNLVGTMVRGVGTVDAFAGEHGRLLLTLENAADTARFALECAVDDADEVIIDLTADGTGRADISIPLERRGRRVIERIRLSTAFPFGLFRAWTWVHLPLAVLAWPVPRGRGEPPAEATSGGTAPAVHRGGDEQWAGLREFREGDSPRQVAWSVFARGRGLLVKTYESPVAHHRTFDLAQVQAADLEARLEQVSAWIVAAHARGESYGLRIDGRELAPDNGNEHRARCLNALALYGTGEPW
jgi:uncharacterized protein (DUF58 family)